MDAVNVALWQALSGDAQLYAALGSQADAHARGVWNGQADEGAPLPLVRFRLILPDFDYTFGGLSSIRLVYDVLAYAEETDEKSGKQLASELAAHLFRVLLDAELEVAGYDLELCRPMSGLPPGEDKSSPTKHSEGLLIEVIISPAD